MNEQPQDDTTQQQLSCLINCKIMKRKPTKNDRVEFKRQVEKYKHVCRSVGFYKQISKVTARRRKIKKERSANVQQFYDSEPEKEVILEVPMSVKERIRFFENYCSTWQHHQPKKVGRLKQVPPQPVIQKYISSAPLSKENLNQSKVSQLKSQLESKGISYGTRPARSYSMRLQSHSQKQELKQYGDKLLGESQILTKISQGKVGQNEDKAKPVQIKNGIRQQ